MSVLFDHRDEFDDRNAFLQVVLGLLACAHEIDGLLPMLEGGTRRHERGSPATALLASLPDDDEPLDDTLCLYLGLASLSRTILHHAATAAATGQESTPPPAAREDKPRPASRRLLEL